MNIATGLGRQLIRIREGFKGGMVFHHLTLVCLLLLVVGSIGLLPAMAGAAYTDHGDGTVTDTTSGLMWKHCAEGQTWAGGTCSGTLAKYNWIQANTLSNSVTFAGKSDWRLPTVSELTTLITATSYSPTISSIDTTVFPYQNHIFWTSTADTGNTANAMYVNFIYGFSATFAKTTPIGAHLVRGVSADVGVVDIAIDQALKLGWNLLGNSLNKSIPVANLFGDPSTVTSVWKWDTAAAKWQIYAPAMTEEALAAYAAGNGYGVLSVLKPGDGYWVNALKGISLPIQTGPPFSLTASDLASGWNLVATADDITPSELNLKLSPIPPGPDSGVPINLTTLWAWENASAKWYFYSPILEAQGGTALSDYITTKGYLDFNATDKRLGNGIGFWVNKTEAPVVLTAPSLTLTMTADDGITPVTSVSNSEPVLVTATVLDADGNPVTKAIATFTVDPLYGAFAGGANTALTNDSGVATVKLTTPNTSGGASTVTASAAVDGQEVQGDLNFSIGSTVLSLSAIDLPAVALSAYGTANVSVNVLSNGEPYTTPIAVSFTSACAASGKATLTPSVTTVNGTATASYLDNGCNNADSGDTITATLLNGVTATGNLKVSSPAVGSLQFISVETDPVTTPPMITLQGTGGINKSETAKVTFRVMDSAGKPFGNALVNFSLNTTLGGLKLTSSSATSDPVTGNVVTSVQAGTMSTVVRVSATTGALYTQSDLLTISTGIPAQDSISISASTLNIEAWNIDGVTTDISVRLADHFHNPVPDGTAVYFTSEGARVDPACTTVNSECTVKLTSQALRPHDGRVTVLARVIGEEAFIDLNSNGTVDSLAEMIDANGDSTDIGEAYVDFNEDGVRNSATEPFIDFNGDGVYNGPDGKYNGMLCTAGADVCSSNQKSLDVRDGIVIVLSSSWADIDINDGLLIDLPADGTPVEFLVTVVDTNGNPMPAGTQVDFSTTNGTILSEASYVVPNTTSASAGNYRVTMQNDSTPSNGVFTVTVTSPKGLITTGTKLVTD